MPEKLDFEWVEPEPEWKIKLRELKARLEVGLPESEKEGSNEQHAD